MFNIKIKKTSLIVASKEPLASGASKIYHVSFDFDEEWDNLLKNVIFKAGDTSVAVLLEGNSCQIPWEVLSSENIGEKLWIGVYGSNNEGTKLPTIWNELEIIQAGAELCGSGSEPTPTAVSLIYSTAKNAENMAKEAIEEASRAGLYSDMADQAKVAAETAANKAEEALGEAEFCVSQTSVLVADAENYAAEAERQKNEVYSAVNEAADWARFAEEKAESAAESAEIARANIADTKKQCASALRGRLFGSSVSADDVSPLEHELDIRVSNKNIIPFPYYSRSSENFYESGIAFTVNDDGSVLVNSNTAGVGATKNIQFHMKYETDNNPILVTQDAIISGSPVHPNSGVKLQAICIQENGKRAYITADGPNPWIKKGWKIERIFIMVSQGTACDNLLFKPQIEYGTVATEFTPPSMDVEGVNVTISNGENTQIGTADAEGNVTGLASLAPSMTLISDNDGAVIECTYNRDTNKVIEELTNAIISLGGNI